jgi:aspartyl protease family protein
VPDAENDWSRFQADAGAGVCPHCQTPLPAGETEDAAQGLHPAMKFGISLAVLGGLMIWLNSVFDVLSFKDNPGQIIYELLFVALISAYVASGRTATKLKGLMIWGLIFMVGMLAYTLRHDLVAVKDRFLGALIPELGTTARDRALRFHVGADGHFHIRAQVNGVPVRFLVDTGASHIVLAPRDAARLGFDRRRLDFDRVYATANGMVRGASIVVEDFQVGRLHLKDVGASVNETGMGESLLGMTFFNRLQRYTVENDVLTIDWAEQ